ncbi:MAG: hypothetical protein KC635_30295, partial [Myxococcales bacterium]|nr:hypothetical protein [Myxococcales bacterium]
ADDAACTSTCALAACGDGGGAGASIAPSDLTSADLEGYWYNAETGNLFAFQRAEDAAWDTLDLVSAVAPEGDRFLTVWNLPPGQQVSPILQQASRYAVADGAIGQVVFFDLSVFAQPLYETAIKAFRAKTSMTLESGRTFTWAPRCEDHAGARVFGWPGLVDMSGDVRAVCDATYFVGWAHVAVDPEGGVHSIATVADNNLSAFGTALRPCTPGAASWRGGGCDARRWPTEYSDGQALALDPTTMTLHSLHSVDDPGNTGPGYVTYRIRPIGQAEDVEPFVAIPALPGSGQVQLAVWARGDAGRVVVDDVIYRRDGEVLTEEPAPTVVGDAPDVRPTLTTFDAAGRLYGLSGRGLFVEGDDNAFDLVPLPRPMIDNGLGASMAVGADGDVHVAYPWAIVTSGGYNAGGRGVYARWDGATWHEVELGRVGRTRVALDDDGVPYVLHALQASGHFTGLLLTRVGAGDRLDSWIAVPGEFVNTSTLDPWTYPDLAIAAGRAAFTGEGGGVMTADLDAFFDLERERDTVSVTLTVAGNGGGRVVSDDGLVDCAATCALELPVGRYLRLRAVADARSTPIGFDGALDPRRDGDDLIASVLVTPSLTSLQARFDLSVASRVTPLAAQALSQTVVALASDGEDVAAVVTSDAPSFSYDGVAYAADAAASSRTYLAQGPLAGPLAVTALDVPVEVRGLRLGAGGAPDLLLAVHRGATVGGVAVGDPQATTLVAATAGPDGALAAPRELFPFAQIVSLGPPSSEPGGLTAMAVTSDLSIVADGYVRRGFLVVDGDDAALHLFEDELVGGAVGSVTVDAAAGAVLALADTRLVYVVGGERAWEVDRGDLFPVGLDAGSPRPMVLGLRPNASGVGQALVAEWRDPATGAVVETEELTRSAPAAVLGFDGRDAARWYVGGASAGAVDPETAWVGLFDDEIASFPWHGQMALHRLRRDADGGSLWWVELTRAGMNASFQALEFTAQDGFIVQMRPLAAAIGD